MTRPVSFTGRLLFPDLTAQAQPLQRVRSFNIGKGGAKIGRGKIIYDQVRFPDCSINFPTTALNQDKELGSHDQEFTILPIWL